MITKQARKYRLERAARGVYQTLQADDRQPPSRIIPSERPSDHPWLPKDRGGWP
jgi:hypothetical protein